MEQYTTNHFLYYQTPQTEFIYLGLLKRRCWRNLATAQKVKIKKEIEKNIFFVKRDKVKVESGSTVVVVSGMGTCEGGGRRRR